MAQRRMFSPDIVCSDAFFDMPTSSRELYFQLGMKADDDGFVNPRSTMRLAGATEDDLKILIAKRFVVPFESGVLVVKHWRVNNFVRKDRYKETLYLEERDKLFVKPNGVYTQDESQGKGLAFVPWKSDVERRKKGVGQPNDIPTVNAGKVRLGINTNTNTNTNTATQSVARKTGKARFTPLGAEILKEFETVDPKNKTYYGNKTQRAACDFLIAEYGFEEVKNRISVLTRTNKIPYFPTITTPFQLREKWVQLQDAVERKRGEITRKTQEII